MSTVIESRPANGLLSRVRDFFYAERVPYGLALIRILLPWVIFLDGLPRWFHVRELYSTDGAPAPIWEAYGMTSGLPIFPAPVAVAGYSVLVVCLIAVSIGWMTRAALIASAVLYLYFIPLDMVSTLNKYTVLSGHALFLLSLSPCGSLWSVDALLKRRRAGTAATSRQRFPVWPQRLIQLLVCIVYLAAAFTKLHTPSFFTGDQLMYWLLTKTTLNSPLGDWMSMYPALVPLMAYCTVIWEIGFVFVSWRGVGRFCMLSFGVVFHVMTLFTLGLIVFPPLYCALYLAWLHEEDVERIAAWWRARFPATETEHVESTATPTVPRWAGWCGPAPSAAAFVLVAAVTAVTAVELEQRSDRFGEHRPEGRYALELLPTERVEELLRSDTRLRSSDKMFAFDIGSRMIGGILANHRDRFDYDEDVVLQCSLLTPHEDMWVEINLHDTLGNIIARHGQFAPREFTRINHTHRFGEALSPGEYRWVLRFDGQDITERPFYLGPTPAVSPATPALVQ
jgi:hypothetical protein